MERLIREILELKRQKDAIILAHNYQRPEIQDLADFTGDSLQLALKAREANAKVIIFAGVHFMAETAAVLNPDKVVLIPDVNAGCSLADSVSHEEVLRWRARHPNGIVVAYVNTRIDVKAVADIVCTSANCKKIIEALPRDRPILFVPDRHMAAYIAEATGRDIDVLGGVCHVHDKFTLDVVRKAVEAHSDAELLLHPECACSAFWREFKSVSVLSTEGMVRHVLESPFRKFLVATEVGLLHKLKKVAPDKTFIPVLEDAICEYMKLITLEKIGNSLRHGVYKIDVPHDIAKRARRAIERMFEYA